MASPKQPWGVEFVPGAAPRVVSADGQPVCLMEWGGEPQILAAGVSAMPELILAALRTVMLAKRHGCPWCRDGVSAEEACPSWLAAVALEKAGLMTRDEVYGHAASKTAS